MTGQYKTNVSIKNKRKMVSMDSFKTVKKEEPSGFNTEAV